MAVVALSLLENKQGTAETRWPLTAEERVTVAVSTEEK
jgi:hypothetical protein